MSTFAIYLNDYLDKRAIREAAELDYLKKRERLRILKRERALGTLSTEKENEYILLNGIEEDVEEEIEEVIGTVELALTDFKSKTTDAEEAYDDLAGFGTHKNLLTNLNDKFPILLFPLRVETKFSLEGSNYKLKVRIYPDIVHAENHEYMLTEDEEKDSIDYFEIVSPAAATIEEKQTAWNTLALKHGSQRAAYIVSLGNPVNFDLQSSSWIRQAEARTLPDKFVVSVYYKSNSSSSTYDYIGDVESGLISDKVKLSVNPNDTESGEGDTENLTLDVGNNLEIAGSIEWLANYQQAVDEGMALTIDLVNLDLAQTLSKLAVESGEIKLVVLGVKISADAELGQTLLEDLIKDHHYTDLGMSILKIGQHTHNTTSTNSSFTTKDLGNKRSYNTEIEATESNIKEIFDDESVFEEQTDGQRLADALGIDHETLYHIENAKGKDIKNALKFNQMLWRATLGYRLEYGFLDIFSPASIEETRKFFTKHVAGRGMLPSIRINEQAYGILPASTFSNWEWGASEPNKVWLDGYTATVQNLSGTMATFTEAKNPVTQGSNPQQDVMGVLNNNPTSTDIYHRYAMGPDFTWNMLSIQNKFGTASAWMSDLNSKASQVMQDLGFPLESPDRMMKLTYMDEEGKYIGPLIQEGKRGGENPLKPIAGTNVNYLQWLATSSFTEILNEDFSNISATTTEPPKGLLYKLARKAILEEYKHAALMLAELYPSQLQIDRTISEFVNISEDTYLLATPPTPVLPEPPPEGTFISGSVRNTEGMTPIANAVIYITTSSGSYLVTTDPMGQFSITIYISMPENVSFKIQKEGFFSFNQVQALIPGSPFIYNPLLSSLNIPSNQILVGGESFLSIMETERSFVINSIPFTGTLYEYIEDPLNLGETWNISLNEARVNLDYTALIAVEDLEGMLREHLDLGSYRLDAWQHSMVHQRIQKNRGTSGFEKGIYLGAYGFIEELKPKTNKQLISESISGITEDIEESVMGGFVHAPTSGQASASAILKSGYLNQESEDNEAKKINLTSERVRIALKFINGVKAGQNLSALLGHEFERGLNTRHSDTLNLNEFIYDFRKAFPIETENETSDELDQPFILNGWKLFVKTRREENAVFPYGLEFLDNEVEGVDVTQDQEAAIEAELDRLANTFDAISDLCIAESVYCIINNNYEKAGAIMNALKSGKIISQEFDFLKTPLTGSVLSHKIALMLDEDSFDEIHSETVLLPVWTGSEITARQKVEPYINKIISGIINDPADIKCKVIYTVPDEEEEEFIFSLDLLGLQALDYAYLFPDELSSDQSELSRLIKLKVKEGITSLSIPALPYNTLIEIKYSEAETGDITFQDFLPLIKRIRNLIANSRNLKVEDFVDPNSVLDENEEPENDLVELYDLDEFFVRVKELKESILNAKTSLSSKITALENEEVDFAVELNNLRDEINKSWQFNIIDAIVDEYVIETNDEAKNAILIQGNDVKNALDLKKKVIEALYLNLEFASDVYQPKIEDIKTLQEITKVVFGDSFTAGSLFNFQNKTEINNAITSHENLIISPLNEDLEVNKWMHGLTKVRPNIREFDLINSMGENILDLKNTMHPIQIPHNSADKWMAISQALTNYDQDKTSIMISYGFQEETDSTNRVINTTNKQAGLLVDEWVEVIPSKEETTGVAMNFDQPNSKPPNCILFTVPHEETGNWGWDKLLSAVNETFYLAKQRAVSPDEISESALGIINKLIDQHYKLNPNVVNSARIDDGVTISLS